jgi:hypothetical protein
VLVNGAAEQGLYVALCPADNHVPKPLVQALFKQLFSFVNVQLFNQLLLRRECCSFSNGEYVKTGLAQVRGLSCKLCASHNQPPSPLRRKVMHLLAIAAQQGQLCISIHLALL